MDRIPRTTPRDRASDRPRRLRTRRPRRFGSHREGPTIGTDGLIARLREPVCAARRASNARATPGSGRLVTPGCRAVSRVSTLQDSSCRNVCHAPLHGLRRVAKLARIRHPPALDARTRPNSTSGLALPTHRLGVRLARVRALSGIFRDPPSQHHLSAGRVAGRAAVSVAEPGSGNGWSVSAPILDRRLSDLAPKCPREGDRIGEP